MSFDRLRDILPQTLADLGIVERVRHERALKAWADTVPGISADLAAGSRALRLRGQSLVVHAADGRIARLLAERRDEIVAGVNARLGSGVIREVDISCAE